MFYVENITNAYWMVVEKTGHQAYYVLQTRYNPEDDNRVFYGDLCYNEFDLEINRIYNLKTQIIQSSPVLDQTLVRSQDNKEMVYFATSKRLFGELILKSGSRAKTIIGI